MEMPEIVVEAYSWARCPCCDHAFELDLDVNSFITDRAGLPPNILVDGADLESAEKRPLPVA